jgi:hypothetical protein
VFTVAPKGRTIAPAGRGIDDGPGDPAGHGEPGGTVAPRSAGGMLGPAAIGKATPSRDYPIRPFVRR